LKVLLVEDERRLAETLRRGLTAEGFMVDVAHDGADGLWLATSNSYDVAVLDIMIPKLNGYDVCRAMRSASVWTPVLMLTAKDGEHDQVDAFDLGADDYLTKPFSFLVMVARLRALVRRGRPERPTVLVAGDLSLDPAAHIVTRADTAIALTPREFAVLHFLIRHKGDVVSKSEILQGVWDGTVALSHCRATSQENLLLVAASEGCRRPVPVSQGVWASPQRVLTEEFAVVAC